MGCHLPRPLPGRQYRRQQHLLLGRLPGGWDIPRRYRSVREGRSEMSQTKPATGSDCPSRGIDRPLFRKNRPLSFPKSAICRPIGGNRHVSCPEKTLFSIYWAEDNLPDGLQSAGKMDRGFSDLIIISSCSGSHTLIGEKKPILGSDYPSWETDRPLFFENRPLSFSNRWIWPRIGGRVPIACPEKTAFSTFWTAVLLLDGQG